MAKRLSRQTKLAFAKKMRGDEVMEEQEHSTSPDLEVLSVNEELFEEEVPAFSEEEAVPPSSEEAVAPTSDEEAVPPASDEEAVPPTSDEEAVLPTSKKGAVPPTSEEEVVVPSASEPFNCSDLAIVWGCRHTLSDNQKYNILTRVSPKASSYPVNKQKRRYQAKWESDYSWLRYSASEDGVFCAPCFLFNESASSQNTTEFVNVPFNDWKNATGVKRGAFKRHSSSKGHLLCLERATSFVAIMEKKKLPIKSQLSKAYDKKVQQNTLALTVIVDCIQFLVKQGLALRGDWNKLTKRESGNFSILVDFVGNYCPELKFHLNHSAKNARYLSPKIQNEFIAINGDIIRENLVSECGNSLFWSVMVDETTDASTSEQMSICVRYVKIIDDTEFEISEEFMGFCTVTSTDAQSLTTAIVNFLTSKGFDMHKLVGKGFDGAANMSGSVSGVSTRLKQLYPNAKYFTHCRNHCLNLAIAASCKECPDIRNFMDTFKQLTFFFGNSAKRKTILSKHVKDNEVQQNLLADSVEDELLLPDRHYQGLPTLSDTRWLTRVDSVDCLVKHFKAICEAVEEIRDSSTGQSARDADSYLKRLLSFEFVASAIISRHVLAFTRPLTVALQDRNCDLLKAHSMAQRLVKTLQAERAEDKFDALWQRIREVAATVNVEPAKRRTVSVQRHRVNPSVSDVQAHYRVAYYFSFLDHTLSHLKTRFPEQLEGALLGTYLLPSKIQLLTNDVVSKLKTEFCDVLPHPTEFDAEISTWKVHVAEVACTLSKSKSDLLDGFRLVHSNRGFYPNIYSILSLLLALPVGSCSCERSFSALRRLKTWCRTTMKESRLDSLALGCINSDRTPPPEHVLQRWDRSGHRRISTAFQTQYD